MVFVNFLKEGRHRGFDLSFEVASSLCFGAWFESWVQIFGMNRLSLKNNWFKFMTSGRVLVRVEQLTDYSSI